MFVRSCVLATNLMAVTFALGFNLAASAQMVPVDGTETTGKAKAQQYFQQRKSSAGKSDRAPASDSGGSSSSGASPHFLSLHIGFYLDDQAYKWGQPASQNDVAQLNLGVTYKLGEWTNAADFMIRSEYSAYSLAGGTARKLDFLAMLMFPDVNSKFPLYFGIGVGPGFYLKQLADQSAMSLDYQVVGGARFLNVIDSLGFFVEFGLKNDIQLFSEGQFNGLFLGAGTAWMF